MFVGKCGTSKIRDGIVRNGMFKMWLETGFSRKVPACLSSVGRRFSTVLASATRRSFLEAGRQPHVHRTMHFEPCSFQVLNERTLSA
jgi:hypothetical protein